jgi:hypothetical protein
MVDPQSLRRVALRLLAMALNDTNPHFVRALVAKAIEYLNRANDAEASGVLRQQPARDTAKAE